MRRLGERERERENENGRNEGRKRKKNRLGLAVSGYVCAYHPKAKGLNPMRNVYVFFNSNLNCDVKRTKVN